MLDGEPGPRSAEPGDHLVGDQQDAVAIAQLAEALEVAVRQRKAAGRPGYRLDHDSGHGGGVLQLQLALQRLQTLNATGRILQPEVAAIAVRVEEADAPWRARLDGRAP